MEQQLHHQERDIAGEVAASSSGGGERLPQWSPAETRVFLSIRAELDQSFAETKRNKRLWEAISSGMVSKGFYRTPEQCKSKWKNLLTRFKGSEVLGEEKSRQAFPYYEEMKSILSGRDQRLLSLEKEKEEEEMQEEEDEGRMTNKKKSKRAKHGRGGGRVFEEVEWALKELAKWQKEREVRWLQVAEAREAERQMAELEWKRMMEAICEERAEMEKRWREREDEWRSRQELRAERRDHIFAAIVARLGRDDGD
ncbi:trihelix transcription factor GT-3b [Phalaenopsis equestris]|uniref:trihelix transcription factor GT-3b n=1 Tax=Phalaenopsis equestris TaxID=78828 RepID=UPI0009E4CA06|nr:trihelix transcription factor GT-3b [Phalaenopsis equestris]